MMQIFDRAKSFSVWWTILAFGAALSVSAAGTNYYVAVEGNDEHDGLSRDRAFATVQRGVDVLAPGDVLNIGPGEYFGSISRKGLGGPDADIVVRAEISGTVILRGDVPAPEFRKLEGFRSVYAADFDREVYTVIESDTLTIFNGVPSVAELEFTPGVFHYDSDDNKLYISTSDFAPADTHRYSVSVVPDTIFKLVEPRRVRLEGLAATGAGLRGQTGDNRGSGIALLRASECVLSDCRAYLNSGSGIYVSYQGWREGHADVGDNIIERSVVWGNERRGIWLMGHRREIIRDSLAYLNTLEGIWVYARGAGVSRLENNLAWGNGQDIEMKASPSPVADRCVGMMFGGASWGRTVKRSLVGAIIGAVGKGERWSDNIMLDGINADPEHEFADPVNHDYRLQAASRFRGAAGDGGDLGPFPYQANIFYVATNGNDRADGLSVSNAWATLERASEALVPGATIYLLPGRHGGGFTIAVEGESSEPVSIRGRGAGVVELTGPVRVSNSRHISFERLRFIGGVVVKGGGELSFEQCAFSSDLESQSRFSCAGPGGAGLLARNVEGLRVIHCEFSGNAASLMGVSACAGVFLAGNRFENTAGLAVSADGHESVLYTDYNFYRKTSRAWRLESRTLSLDGLPAGWERYGVAGDQDGAKTVSGSGLYDRPAGNFRLAPGKAARLAGPFMHAVGATSANIEWYASRGLALEQGPVIELAWGETPECEERLTVPKPFRAFADSERFGSHFGSFSLTGLKPSTRYYVSLRSVEPPERRREITPVEWDASVISFTTAETYPAPVTYYVSPEGHDANSGLEHALALRTLNRAADLVRPGDTVRIAGGLYKERLYVRATGTPGRPITFAAAPGEKVTLDGGDKMLNNLMSSFYKSHLRFDGFHLTGVLMAGSSGAVRVFGGQDVQLSRILYDGRGGYSPKFMVAYGVRDMLVRNCIGLNAFSGSSYFILCPGFRMENSINYHNLIGGMTITGTRDKKALVRDSIITDCQENKIEVPVGPTGATAFLDVENNAYYMRPERETMSLPGRMPRLDAGAFEEQVLQNGGLTGDPRFAGLFRDGAYMGDGFTFNVQVLVCTARFPVGSLTFADFFANNPEFVERGIGLNPSDFADFYPNKDYQPNGSEIDHESP